ncbi:MarR family transcriptional regulator [Erythrobacter sp. SDW2]|uniref:MarR family winged helix-turn-helix transcriptional regulator n=1 Tax=Erythrobacter sp. SDW2 TaxID=2907154 RepID=UPI001F4538BF|nr:MarR family transcriptional regulator [Erythrobacter sp. SDW2]UIP05545.1 MarR family transcriptional regulator [Erythrobacter sp. SDW2]
MDKNLAWLMSDSTRLLRRAFEERVRVTGITAPQARLLLALDRSPGENQAFYADRLEVEPITLCRMVDRMEEGGLVERRHDPADRRARLLHLTATAEGEVARIRSALDGMLDQMVAGLDEREQDELLRMLQVVTRNLTPSARVESVAHG